MFVSRKKQLSMAIFKIPENIKLALSMLHDAGFEAYVVGGSVRDTLLGVQPHDWDIATSAQPNQIKNVFAAYRQIDIGARHGTVAVLINNETIEITTFRIDGKYSDGRRPDNVYFTKNIVEDLSRRDFTINACAITDTRIIDPFGGRDDIKKRLIRCVGDPEKRFREDALRILRAIRFASVLGFDVEEKTVRAVFDCKDLLSNVSQERITEEFKKTLLGCNVKNTLSRFSGVVAVTVPQAKELIEFDGGKLYEHTLKAVENADADLILRTCMFFHDIATPRCLKQDSDADCCEESARLAEKILRRMKFSNKEIAAVTQLIRYCGKEIEPSKISVKKTLSVLGKEQFGRLIKAKRADLSAQPHSNNEIETLDAVEAIYNDLISQNACLTLNDLAINGNDIISIGIPKGKQVGVILNRLFELVLNDEIKNDKDALIRYVIDNFSNKAV